MLKVCAYRTDGGEKTYMGDFNFNLEPDPNDAKTNKSQTGSLYNLKHRGSFRTESMPDSGYMVFSAE